MRQDFHYISSIMAAGPCLLFREPSPLNAGIKNPALLCEGVKAGANHHANSSFPHPVVGATAARFTEPGLDERDTSRSSDFELSLIASPYHLMKNSGIMKRSSLVTAALPRGICTRFPILR
jgi:hypothetical protein